MNIKCQERFEVIAQAVSSRAVPLMYDVIER